MGDRGQMRRRLRDQRRVREALLLDLGALVYELHRHGRRAPELLQSKAAELTVVDDEVRELQDALAGGADGAPASTSETGELDVWEEGEPEPLEDAAEPLDDAPEPALADHEEPRA